MSDVSHGKNCLGYKLVVWNSSKLELLCMCYCVILVIFGQEVLGDEKW